jgi:hypothetical protein
MQKQKNIQMPASFVFDVYRLILKLGNYALDIDTAKLCNSLESQIEVKLEAMNARDAFSKYKAAIPGSQERETLRRQYLELAHIHKDWISTIETDP